MRIESLVISILATGCCWGKSSGSVAGGEFIEPFDISEDFTSDDLNSALGTDDLTSGASLDEYCRQLCSYGAVYDGVYNGVHDGTTIDSCTLTLHETPAELPDDPGTESDDDGTLDDTGTIAADTGTTEDTGTEDTGAVATDTGTTEVTGTTADTGALAADTGTTADTAEAIDTGPVVTDTGTTEDSGAVADTGSAEDTGAVADTGTAEDTDSEPSECSTDDPEEAPPDPIVASIVCSGEMLGYWGSSRGGGCMGGRKPLKFRSPSLHSNSPIGASLAGMAHMETVSVTAFQELAEQLRAYDAPEYFVTRCLDAAQDEVLHAKMLTVLAKSYGGTFLGKVEPCPTPSGMLEVALNNAVEGCVHETWAACLATHQAVAAPSADLRRVFTKIARDEVRHAQLAWDLHEWFLTQLNDSEAQQVVAAQQQALAALVAAAPTNNHQELGFPSDEKTQTLKSLFAQQVAA